MMVIVAAIELQEAVDIEVFCLTQLFGDALAGGLCQSLGLEAMLFTWDQCLIMGFSEVLPRILFCVLMVIKEALIQAEKWDDLEPVLINR